MNQPKQQSDYAMAAAMETAVKKAAAAALTSNNGDWLLDEEVFQSLPIDDILRNADPTEEIDPAQIDRLFVRNIKQDVLKTNNQSNYEQQDLKNDEEVTENRKQRNPKHLEMSNEESRPETPSTADSTTPSFRSRARTRATSCIENGAASPRQVMKGFLQKAKRLNQRKAAGRYINHKNSADKINHDEKQPDTRTTTSDEEREQEVEVSNEEGIRQAASSLSIVCSRHDEEEASSLRRVIESYNATGQFLSQKESEIAETSTTPENSKGSETQKIMERMEARFTPKLDAIQKSLTNIPEGKVKEEEEVLLRRRPESSDLGLFVTTERLDSIVDAVDRKFAPRFDSIERSLLAIQKTLTTLTTETIQSQQNIQQTKMGPSKNLHSSLHTAAPLTSLNKIREDIKESLKKSPSDCEQSISSKCSKSKAPPLTPINISKSMSQNQNKVSDHLKTKPKKLSSTANKIAFKDPETVDTSLTRRGYDRGVISQQLRSLETLDDEDSKQASSQSPAAYPQRGAHHLLTRWHRIHEQDLSLPNKEETALSPIRPRRLMYRPAILTRLQASEDIETIGSTNIIREDRGSGKGYSNERRTEFIESYDMAISNRPSCNTSSTETSPDKITTKDLLAKYSVLMNIDETVDNSGKKNEPRPAQPAVLDVKTYMAPEPLASPVQESDSPMKLQPNVSPSRNESDDICFQEYPGSAHLKHVSPALSSHPSDEECGRTLSSSSTSSVQSGCPAAAGAYTLTNKVGGDSNCQLLETSVFAASSGLTDENQHDGGQIMEDVITVEENILPTEQQATSERCDLMEQFIASTDLNEEPLFKKTDKRKDRVDNCTLLTLPPRLRPGLPLQYRSLSYPLLCPRIGNKMMDYMDVVPPMEAQLPGVRQHGASPNSILADSKNDGPTVYHSLQQQVQGNIGPFQEPCNTSMPERQHPAEIVVSRDTSFHSPCVSSTISQSVTSELVPTNEGALHSSNLPKFFVSKSNSPTNVPCCNPSGTLNLFRTTGNAVSCGAAEQCDLQDQGGSIVWSNPGGNNFNQLPASANDQGIDQPVLPYLDEYSRAHPAFAIIAQKIAEAEGLLRADILSRDTADETENQAAQKDINHKSLSRDDDDNAKASLVDRNDNSLSESYNDGEDEDKTREDGYAAISEIEQPQQHRLSFHSSSSLIGSHARSPRTSTTVLADSGDMYVELVHVGSAALFDTPATPTVSVISIDTSEGTSLCSADNEDAYLTDEEDALTGKISTASSAMQGGKASFLERFQARKQVYQEQKHEIPSTPCENQQIRNQLIIDSKDTKNKNNPDSPPVSVEQLKSRSSCSSVTTGPAPKYTSSKKEAYCLSSAPATPSTNDEATGEQDAAQVFEIVERYYHYHENYNAGNPAHFTVSLEERLREPLDQLLSWTMVAFEEIEKDFLTSFHEKAMEGMGITMLEDSTRIEQVKQQQKTEQSQQHIAGKITEAASPKNDPASTTPGSPQQTFMSSSAMEEECDETLDPLKRLGIFAIEHAFHSSSSGSGSSSSRGSQSAASSDSDDSSMSEDDSRDDDPNIELLRNLLTSMNNDDERVS